MPSREQRLAEDIHRVAGILYRLPNGHPQTNNGLHALERLAAVYRDVTGREAVNLLTSDLQYGPKVYRLLRGTERAPKHDWRPIGYDP